MNDTVRLVAIEPHPIAAVRRQARIANIPRVLIAGLDIVWPVVRAIQQPPYGRNVAIYCNLGGEVDMLCGVEVASRFDPVGEVACLQTPAGEAATAIHRGAYDRLGETYDAITNFVARNGRHLAGINIEIYGHWREGPFHGFHAVTASVSKTCLVRFDNNKYSVMAGAVGRPVEVQVYADRIVIRQDGRIVGEHPRSFCRDMIVYNPWHYVPVLARKPGALRNGAPFKDWILPDAIEERSRERRQGVEASSPSLKLGCNPTRVANTLRVRCTRRRREIADGLVLALA